MWSIKFQVYKDSQSQCLEMTKEFRTHNLYQLQFSYAKLGYNPSKMYTYLQIKFQEVASVPYIPSSSGQTTTPKPLPFGNPEASPGAPWEFLGTTPLNKFSTGTV